MKKSVVYYPQEGVAVTCRSYREYKAMFALEDSSLSNGPILDVAAGASSFVAQARSQGVDAYAADPRYSKAPQALYEESLLEIGTSAEKLAKLKDRYDWTFYGSIDEHRAGRKRSLERFIADYSAEYLRKEQSVYVPALLPNLPFNDGTFSLVLCSHFLFLYEEQFDPKFHMDAVQELYRVVRPGGELRIYPLLNLRFEPYTTISDIVRSLTSRGAKAEKLASRLPFIPGSTELLRAVKPYF